MQFRRMRIELVCASALLVATSACGPKGGDGAGTPTPGATPVRPTWGEDATRMLEMGLAGPRLFWNEPSIRPGERVRWVITGRSFPDRILEVERIADPAGAERWTLVAGHPVSPRRRLAVTRSGGRVTSLAMSGKDLAPSETSDATFLAEVVPLALAGSAGEAGFAAIGGTFLGNEVVRVAAGEFRARHAVVPQGGNNWHLYLVRLVPGGIAKVEMFPGDALEPTLVMELDDLTRLPKPTPD